MAKRPSVTSVRSRQHRVIRYIYSTDLQTAARHYNVSTKQLERFISNDPKRMKSRVQKDPAYLRLYQTDPKELAREQDVRLVPRLSRKRYYALQKPGVTPTERQQLAINYRTVTRTRIYHKSATGKISYTQATERENQTIQSRESLLIQGYGQYTTVAALQAGYSDGDLQIRDVQTIVGVWKENYNLKQDRVDDILEAILNEDYESLEESGE